MEKIKTQQNFFIKIISDKTNSTITIEDSGVTPMNDVAYDTMMLEDIYHIFGDCTSTFMTNMYAVNRSEVTIQFDDPWTRMIYTVKISDVNKFEKPRTTIQESIHQYWCDHITDQDLHEPKDSLPMNYNAAWSRNNFRKEYSLMEDQRIDGSARRRRIPPISSTRSFSPTLERTRRN